MNYDKVFQRLDVLEQIERLKNQIDQVEDIVKEDINTNDVDIKKLNERMKEIQKQIENMM